MYKLLRINKMKKKLNLKLRVMKIKIKKRLTSNMKRIITMQKGRNTRSTRMMNIHLMIIRTNVQMNNHLSTLSNLRKKSPPNSMI